MTSAYVVRVRHKPDGFNNPVGGGGQPPRKPDWANPGRSHEEEEFAAVSQCFETRTTEKADMIAKYEGTIMTRRSSELPPLPSGQWRRRLMSASLRYEGVRE